MRDAVWLLEEFDRSTGAYRCRHQLAGLSDAKVRSWLELERLDGDLYDVPAEGLTDISRRYGIPVLPAEVEYLLAREADPAG
ncbi:hypothetical protein AB0O51_14585 [Streptomyces sp. NPDC090301]|uniref:hypothetical protein n=1 Tax=Streptomyces sp. NPDC090301 TaxID=3154975 RepID=UPI003413E7D4